MIRFIGLTKIEIVIFFFFFEDCCLQSGFFQISWLLVQDVFSEFSLLNLKDTDVSVLNIFHEAAINHHNLSRSLLTAG